jgi:DNA-binding transcriptional MerR regulator
MTLLCPRDVARRLGLSTSRVIQLDNAGALKAMRDSAGRRLYDPDVVEEFAQAREEQAYAAVVAEVFRDIEYA